MTNRLRKHSSFYGCFGSRSPALLVWTSRYSVRSYVRQVLERANQVFYPGHKKVLTLFDHVKRAATKMVTGPLILRRVSLEYRRIRGDLMLNCVLFEQGLANTNTHRKHGPRKLERSMPIHYLRRSTIVQQYRSELAQQLSTCTGSASVDEAWQNVKGVMLAAFSAVSPTSPIRPQNHWISARSLSMIDARKSIPAGNDSPLTVLYLRTNLSVLDSNAPLPTQHPEIIGERNCGSYNHCATTTRLLQLTMMMKRNFTDRVCVSVLAVGVLKSADNIPKEDLERKQNSGMKPFDSHPTLQKGHKNIRRKPLWHQPDSHGIGYRQRQIRLFVFGEFLDHPCVQNLLHGPHAAFADLLNLFCYGSFETYSAEPTKYPQLSSAQIRKLKQLSIIDEAHSRKLIPYESLFKKLGVESSRELEDLIIELFYLDALTGKLDQQRALLEVDSAIGRDVRIEQIPELNATMNTWLDRVESILTHIANEVKLANDRRFEMQLHKKRVQEAAASVKEALRGQLSKTEVSEAGPMEILRCIDVMPRFSIDPLRTSQWVARHYWYLRFKSKPSCSRQDWMADAVYFRQNITIAESRGRWETR
ncbi:COP9 signalosome complex subunit 7 [Clonorchis sinensis]|uniref:COP9 signalosome complex subunit 7 n=1 Tax=Clonorchis sinensis TaxID=79923 RepID=G7Y6N2_CLOSI|nr:COP9 signalosome complex subunit 7 [Clonorchis sinensis]